MLCPRGTHVGFWMASPCPSSPWSPSWGPWVLASWVMFKIFLYKSINSTNLNNMLLLRVFNTDIKVHWSRCCKYLCIYSLPFLYWKSYIELNHGIHLQLIHLYEWDMTKNLSNYPHYRPLPFQAVRVYFRCLRPSVCPSVRQLYLLRTINRHKFELESPNLYQTCILWYSGLVLKIGIIDLDLQGHFGHFDLEF